MSTHDFERLAVPAQLIRLAEEIGVRPDLVQGAGGNISMKHGDLLWVKASGTRLKDASHKPIFVPLNLEEARDQVLLREDLSNLSLDSLTRETLRPSIETAIHALLPQTFVVHVHAIGAISRAIDSSFTPSQLPFSDVHFAQIGYHKPGIALARAILEVAETTKTSTESLVVLLGNHGIIAAADSAELPLRLISELENEWSNIYLDSPAPSSTRYEWRQLYVAGTLTDRMREVLSGGVLTPDEAVFLGRKPFVVNDNLEQLDASILAACMSDGSVWVRASASDDAVEITQSFVNIAMNVRDGAEISYLTNREVDDLLDWDAEKWRQQQSKA